MLKELVGSLATTYGPQLKRVVLYGSYARGEETPESDMDVLIVLEQLDNLNNEIKQLVPIEAELNLKYGIWPACIPVSLRDYEKANTPFLMNVQREGVIVHE